MVQIRCSRLPVVLAWVSGLVNQVVVAQDAVGLTSDVGPDADDQMTMANGAAVSVAITFGLAGGFLLLLYLLLKVRFRGVNSPRVSSTRVLL